MSGISLRTNNGVFVALITMAVAFFALMFLSTFIVSNIEGIAGVAIVGVLGGALFVGAFKVAEMIAPTPKAPENLSIGGVTLEFKDIWKSKTFWLAVAMLAVNVVNIAAGTELLDQTFVDQIAALDWSNWVGTLIPLAMIIVRKFFTGDGVK